VRTEWWDVRDWDEEACQDLPDSIKGPCGAFVDTVTAPAQSLYDGGEWLGEKAADKGSEVLHSAAVSTWEAIVGDFSQGSKSVMEMIVSAWVYTPTPTPGSTDGTPTGSSTEWIHAHTLWLTAAISIATLLIAAGRMAWQRRGDAAVDALRGILNLIVVNACALAVVANLVLAGDSFATWLIESAIKDPNEPPGDFGTHLLAITAVEVPLNAALALILAIVGIVGGLIQVALLVLRYVMLVLLCGVLPLAAASSSTPTGRAWLSRCCTWLGAFVLYKPAAAIVYATAFRMFQDRSSSFEQVAGLLLIALACLTLPVLMRFIAPMTSAVASGGGMAQALGAMAGQAGVALGAKAVPALGAMGAGGKKSGGDKGGDKDSGEGAQGAAPTGPDQANDVAGGAGMPSADTGTETGAGAQRAADGAGSPVPGGASGAESTGTASQAASGAVGAAETGSGGGSGGGTASDSPGTAPGAGSVPAQGGAPGPVPHGATPSGGGLPIPSGPGSIPAGAAVSAAVASGASTAPNASASSTPTSASPAGRAPAGLPEQEGPRGSTP